MSMTNPELSIDSAQLVTVQVALGDAYAYRLGEANGLDDPDLDDVDRAACERYLALTDELGIEIL